MPKTTKPAPAASRPSANKPGEGPPKIVFGRHGAPVTMDIRAGEKVVVEYDPERSPIQGGVTAFIEFQPSGTRIEAPAVKLEATRPQPFMVPISIDVPRGTTAISMWFRQFKKDQPIEAWDSNFGRNYQLAVTGP